MEPQRRPIPRIKNPSPSSGYLCSAPTNQQLICRPTAINFKSLQQSAQRPSVVCFVEKPVTRSSVGSSLSLSTAAAMLSVSQDELADKYTRLSEKFNQTMSLYKPAFSEYQAMSATEKGEHKDKLTKLLCLENKLTKLSKELQQTMSNKDLYDSAFKELQAMSTDNLFDCQELPPEYLRNFACNPPTEKDMFKEKRSILEQDGALSLDGAEAFRKYYGLEGENVEASTSGANMNSDKLKLATELADVGRQREAVLATCMQEEPGSFEKLSELRKYVSGTVNERIKGEGEDDVTVEHESELEDNLTRLRKEHYRTISADPVYNVAFNSATQKDARGSIVNEPLKDDELLFSLSSQPPNFALPQETEGREHNFALPQNC